MKKLESRWNRRQTGLEPLTLHGATAIAASREEVWNFLMAPESAPLTDDRVVRSFRVPGTPIGEAGEQQCVVYEVDGQLIAHIVELVVAERPGRIVLRSRTTPTTHTHVLEGTPDGGTVLTCQADLQVCTGTIENVVPELQAQMNDCLTRVRTAIESGVRFPDPTLAQREGG